MQPRKENKGNIYGYLIFILAVSLIMIIRLFQVQVIDADLYRAKSAQNTIQTETITAKRGDILDRNGVPLANSQAKASIKIDTKKTEDEVEESIINLAEILTPKGYDEAVIRNVLTKAEEEGVLGSVEIVNLDYYPGDGITYVSQVYERSRYLPAVEVDVEPMRYYPNGTTLGVTLGYVGAISAEEYAGNEKIYSQNDKIGKMGIEKGYEIFQKEGTNLVGLKGINGTQEVEVDITGQVVSTKEVKQAAQAGDNVTMTIDLTLQKALDDALAAQVEIAKGETTKAGSGAAIVMDVQTGEILAMSSMPIFDPNDFIQGLDASKEEYYINNELSPMLNKVTASSQPPGSVFKMVTAAAGLTYGGQTPSTTYYCNKEDPPFVPCTGNHGTTDLYKGLEYSCNIYFQNVGVNTGVDNISKVAKEYGLGADPGLTDIDEVSKGFLPTKESKASLMKDYTDGMINQITEETATEIVNVNQDSTLSENEKKQKISELEAAKESAIAAQQSNYEIEKDWYDGDTYNMSMGQGFNNYTVLQLGEYVSTIANGGTRMEPHLVKKVEPADGSSAYEVQPVVLNKVSTSAESLDAIKAGMRLVVQEGTAATAFSGCPIAVAGKTGTAETGRAGDKDADLHHGSFVGYAPYDNPKIAVAVYVEYGKGSSTAAATVARQIIESYFNMQGETNE